MCVCTDSSTKLPKDAITYSIHIGEINVTNTALKPHFGSTNSKNIPKNFVLLPLQKLLQDHK